MHDEAAFAAIADRHRAELRVHCYRMLGSLEDAEDHVQETFLRAWRGRARFDGTAARAWLYRIATNACLDTLRRRPRRVFAEELGPPGDPGVPPVRADEQPWMQPFPDRLAPAEDEPGAVLVARETIEIAFLAAIQHLPPRQRAVLIHRDVLGSSAQETADALDSSVNSVNSALQRARATLRDRLGERRSDWTRTASPSEQERELLERYIDAHERADVDALGVLLREDARLTMPPHTTWFDSRAAILTAMEQGFDPEFGRLRGRITAANRQPAAAWYLRRPDDDAYRALALDVLRIEDGRVAQICSFVYPELFGAFGLPMSI
jgi:RNA polymerase sigma-70 factor (ECF subfamily)